MIQKNYFQLEIIHRVSNFSARMAEVEFGDVGSIAAGVPETSC